MESQDLNDSSVLLILYFFSFVFLGFDGNMMILWNPFRSHPGFFH